MTLRVPLEEFAEAVRGVVGTDRAYAHESAAGTSLSAGAAGCGAIVLCHVARPLSSVRPEIEAAAHAAGIDYRHVPVAGGFTAEGINAMAETTETQGVTLAFCKSGTRSALLWALARAQAGDDPEELEAKASA